MMYERGSRQNRSVGTKRATSLRWLRRQSNFDCDPCSQQSELYTALPQLQMEFNLSQDKFRNQANYQICVIRANYNVFKVSIDPRNYTRAKALWILCL